ncbi:hypothetical protein J6590_024667 [Homalodisca vitripennis]|nr:hypothetical protein J6590_024667 [Homalodisca vitripennis]
MPVIAQEAASHMINHCRDVVLQSSECFPRYIWVSNYIICFCRRIERYFVALTFIQFSHSFCVFGNGQNEDG